MKYIVEAKKRIDEAAAAKKAQDAVAEVVVAAKMDASAKYAEEDASTEATVEVIADESKSVDEAVGEEHIDADLEFAHLLTQMLSS